MQFKFLSQVHLYIELTFIQCFKMFYTILTFYIDKLTFTGVIHYALLIDLLRLTYTHHHLHPLHHKLHNLVLIRLVLFIRPYGSEPFQDHRDEEVQEYDIEHETKEPKQGWPHNLRLSHHWVVVKLVCKHLLLSCSLHIISL